jgi:replication initiation and membrane attachment protein DnaB
LDESKLAAEYWAKTKTTGVSRREVITQLAKEYHVSSKQIYTIVERSKRSGE